MGNRHMYYYTMPDGTVKQINPFSGREVWCVPGRSNKPITNIIPETAKSFDWERPESYCNFCETAYINTPPEKARLVLNGKGGKGSPGHNAGSVAARGGGRVGRAEDSSAEDSSDGGASEGNGRYGDYETLEHLPASLLGKSTADFRRIPNLFEIVTFDYWAKNYDYRLSETNDRWKSDYLAEPEGLAHVRNILGLKLKLSGWAKPDIDALDDGRLSELSTPFFGGGHELVVARRHFIDQATYDVELCSSGELTPDEHLTYLKFTIDAMNDIYANNRYVRYISVFQNWLAKAGASFDHLHKQLVALDDWGVAITRELELVKQNPNIYNELAVNLAAHSNLVFAENENAIAFADIGHQFPTLAIFSKSPAGRPDELSEDELADFSSLLHACHAAGGSQISCNEEWYYTPRDSIVKMPWHVLIKWRINTPAGFEHGTKIFINPITPVQLRDTVVPRLYELRNQEKINGFSIAEECELQPNSLRYSL